MRTYWELTKKMKHVSRRHIQNSPQQGHECFFVIVAYPYTKPQTTSAGSVTCYRPIKRWPDGYNAWQLCIRISPADRWITIRSLANVQRGQVLSIGDLSKGRQWVKPQDFFLHENKHSWSTVYEWLHYIWDLLYLIIRTTREGRYC